ncbi:MAG: GPR endopeptidase [Clostridia bacterium]|nr:GPR endopeptidase [Clostridia bacterium]
MSNYGYFTNRPSDEPFPYTDLACERHRADLSLEGVSYKKEHASCGFWERIEISSDTGAKSIGRPIGRYDTLTLDRLDLMDLYTIEDAKDEIAKELCVLCDALDIVPERVLVAGLGNPSLMPDAVGPLAANHVKATMHIKDFDKRFFGLLECSEIAVVTPGVRALSGMDAASVVRGIADVISPSLIIAIDSIAARDVERLGTTVQMCDSGILPGSGLGNCAVALNEETLGAPVIAIGVPTVIDSRMFRLDTNPEKIKDIDPGPAMFVSPKEICEIVDVGASIIGGGINQAFGLYS